MFVTGLGEVKGLGPMTKICTPGGAVVRVRALDDQWLSLYVPCLFNGQSIVAGHTDDNAKLRRRLKRTNPHLIPA